MAKSSSFLMAYFALAVSTIVKSEFALSDKLTLNCALFHNIAQTTPANAILGNIVPYPLWMYGQGQNLVK